jgi:hypothetical protein
MNARSMFDLITDPDVIGKLSDADFNAYWGALGVVVRMTTRQQAAVETAPRNEYEVGCTSANTERRWVPSVDAPATAAAGFGFRQ